jgi:proteasome activator subunit 4
VKDLILDWRPLFKELKVFVLPLESGLTQQGTNVKRNYRTLAKLCTFAQLYFDPQEIPAMLEEVLPYYNTSFVEGAFVVSGLFNLLFPTSAPPADREKLLPQHYLPTFFHLWSLVNRSKVFDTTFLDLFSRLARDSLPAEHVPISEYGIFTRDQSSLIFTAILRLLEIPVGQATSPYSATVDAGAGLGIMLERDPKKHPIGHQIARWIVMSLTPACLEKPDSILSNLEGLIQAVETFFHPSNSGAWTRMLSQLVYYLADFFVMRWNRERSGEMDIPVERRLNDALKKRFVLCLREVIFMGIYSKSVTAMNFSLSTLQSLAYLEPNLILPGALQRIYPSMQGLVEVHRTTSSLRALQALSKIMVRTKGFRCHVTTMLGLALPGIDANDLDKTLYALSYMQAVCYNIPFHDLTKGEKESSGSMLAVEWVTSEVGRMEQEGVNVELDYAHTLADEDEELILRSSTAGLSEFLSSFLGKVFTLLENLPDAARVRSGSPEENVINTLPATFTPLLATLSPELYDIALNKIADFVGNHVIHQARDAMAFICNSLCKIWPEKALKILIPVLIASIRTEIDENGAASTRNTGSDVLPRDRGLVWHVSMLSMCVVHVGDAVLPYRKELYDIAVYMQEKCQGIPTVHISNYIHHLLLNLTGIYTVDFSVYEPSALARGLTPADWGRITSPDELTIKWHVPRTEEIDFATDLFKSQAEAAMNSLTSLLDGTSPIKRDGTGKAWSDELSRNLVLIRLLLAGVAVLFDPNPDSKRSPPKPHGSSEDAEMTDGNGVMPEEDEDDLLAPNLQDAVRPTFHYSDGYALTPGEPVYEEIHELRMRLGRLLHDVHHFLVANNEDDVSCFTPLYTAYKAWFIDVGIEKSAHVLDRVTRLYSADTSPYRISGLRKQYPRSLLLRRANVYHLQRLRHNASTRHMSDMEKQLLLDLAESSVSSYTEVRRNAQSAIESAGKSVIGARPSLLHPLLKEFEIGVKETDYGRIKGGMFLLLFGALAKALARDWRYVPRMIKTYLAACAVDKPSIQKLCATGTFQVMEFGRALERMAILDQDIVRAIAPVDIHLDGEIAKKIEYIKERRAVVEARKAALSDELVEITKEAHWKTASRTAAIVVTLGFRFDSLASDNLIDLLASGSIDSHPGLRGLYSGALVALFGLLGTRVVFQHDYKNYLLDKPFINGKLEVGTGRQNPNWTTEYLASFAQADAAYYVDHEFPGWLVWSNTMPAYSANLREGDDYDEVEQRVINRIGGALTREWFSTFFGYLLQEPRDSSADKFRMASAIMLGYVFELVHNGRSAATFDEIKKEIINTFGDGTDKHQHRATAEILGGLLGSAHDKKLEHRTMIWNFCMPLVLKVFTDGLTPENSGYWTTFQHLLLQGKDPRRSWPLLEWLAAFRLDMSSNAAFKESSKIMLLQQCITDSGWHFQLEKGVLANFLQHIDHPYKGVREAMGHTLAAIYRTRYHESYQDIDTLIACQKAASSIGVRPYQPTDEFSATIREVFGRLERWRKERAPGQQTPSSYTSGSKTVLLWLDSTLSSYECTQLLEFFPGLFLEQLLHMMDIKEDQELQGLAYHVFRHIPNIPHRIGEDAELIDALIRIGKTSVLWHQRLRVLINIQVMYFRRLFLIPRAQQQRLFDCVADMLNDTQLEVRTGASSTLSGMIRCSPVVLRTGFVKNLNEKFTAMLVNNPLPKKARYNLSAPGTGTSTPTPEHNRLVLTRHAAVLGLGALVQAFPYSSTPPEWIPGVLTTLANRANSDPGVVGKSVKSILADYKKIRQDTWHMDLKVRTRLWSLSLSPSPPPHPHPLRNRLTSVPQRSSLRNRWRIWRACCGRAISPRAVSARAAAWSDGCMGRRFGMAAVRAREHSAGRRVACMQAHGGSA